jgi:serine/threonine protein kinase
MSSPSPTPNAEPLTVDEFLKNVVRSGVLDREQVKAALASAPPEAKARSADADALAEFLVRTGKLSRFQARKLLRAAYRGLVLGPYQILAPLGKGGMGAVFMARDGRDGRLVALKVLSSRRARAEDRTRSRFLREMELNQRVSHTHLAETYEVGTIQDVHFIAMEFIPGKSLHRVVQDAGPLTVARSARLLAEVAAALEHAHEKGLIHRDLKPSNIMVTPNDHAKVLDFGLALVQGEKADVAVVGGEGYIVGTMDYISPEQSLNPTRVDARSDIYSLGCTLYYALTGQPPFPGGTSQEKRQRHRAEEPTPLWQLRAGLPTPFVDFVQSLMAKDPAMRPPSAAAVRDQLLAWVTEDETLPLDRPNDTNYRIAVAQLEDASNDGFVLEDIPAQPSVPEIELPPLAVAEMPVEYWAAPTVAESVEPDPVPGRDVPAWVVVVLIVGIPSLLLGLAFCIAGLAVFLLERQ